MAWCRHRGPHWIQIDEGVHARITFHWISGVGDSENGHLKRGQKSGTLATLPMYMEGT
jgi:hypothetical protein